MPESNFVIIHTSPGQGAGSRIVAATHASDAPPNSSRVEIYAADQAEADAIAFGRNEGRPGVYRVFPLLAPAISIPQGIDTSSETKGNVL